MTLEELAQEAAKAINQTPPGFEAKITLIMPGQWGKSNKKRLVSKGKCPVGYIINEDETGLWVHFDALDVLAYCVANGVREVTITAGSQEAEIRDNSNQEKNL